MEEYEETQVSRDGSVVTIKQGQVGVELILLGLCKTAVGFVEAGNSPDSVSSCMHASVFEIQRGLDT